MSGVRSVRIMVVQGVSGSHLQQSVNEAINRLEYMTLPKDNLRIADIKITTTPLLAVIIYSTGESDGGFGDRRVEQEEKES